MRLLKTVTFAVVMGITVFCVTYSVVYLILMAACR